MLQSKFKAIVLSFSSSLAHHSCQLVMMLTNTNTIQCIIGISNIGGKMTPFPSGNIEFYRESGYVEGGGGIRSCKIVALANY